MAGSSQAAEAQARWELENRVQTVADIDSLWSYDKVEQQNHFSMSPWSRDPHYFKHVKMSALALLKIAIHAKSGGNLEVMGVMQGKIKNDTFIVLDAFALPVEGTETRVNAQGEAYEYLVQFTDLCKEVGRPENVLGWYHSHPGYGCWLSGIDVGTQMTNQKYQEPFLAIVVDPTRTESAGKVDIGAFRTFPEGYKPPAAAAQEYQTIPLEKIEDFGVHANSYYPLDVTFFKSSVDAHLLELLWAKYWVNTLSASPLVSGRDFAAGQIADIAAKLEQETTTRWKRAGGGTDGDDSKLLQIVKDTNKMATEQLKGLSSQVIKQVLLNGVTEPAATPAGAPPSPAPPVVPEAKPGGDVAPMET